MYIKALLVVLMVSVPVSANDLNSDVQRWMIVNDTVMGGRSQANLSLVEGEGEVFRFDGLLSLENNGGFASIRAVFPRKYFANSEHICIRVRGDGRKYQLRLRGGRQLDGIAFAQTFNTEPGKWLNYSFKVSEFVPTFRGRTLRNVRDIMSEEIRQVTFMIADKSEGEFQLDFTSINPCSPNATI